LCVPVAASFVPINPPMAPAPTIQIFIVQSLEAIAKV
jgi:hypothetical protein